MYEALTYILLYRKLAGFELAASTRARLAVLRDTKHNCQESLAIAHEELENDPCIDTLISSTFGEVEGSDMATYWLDFMMNVYAIHTCNWKQYLISLREMMPWLMIYDQTNYGRWLPYFWAMLSSLSADQTQFFSSNFAQSMTGNPYSSIPWDMWIEMTLNKVQK